jgi:hypothetical protein
MSQKHLILSRDSAKAGAKIIPEDHKVKSGHVSISDPDEKGSATGTLLDEVVRMAIADGVLTPNERRLIMDLALKNGLNYEEIIREVEKRMARQDIESETQLIGINKKRGNDFEKYVVRKFNPLYFRLKEWAGDKYVNGIYAENTLKSFSKPVDKNFFFDPVNKRLS